MTNHEALANLHRSLLELAITLKDPHTKQQMAQIAKQLAELLSDMANQREAQRDHYRHLQLFIENELTMRRRVRGWSEIQRTAKLAEAEKSMRALQHLIPWQWQDAPEQVQASLFQQEAIND